MRRRRTPVERVLARPGPPFEITFDGRPLTALPGQSIAAALWSSGVLAWRTTRVGGRPRGAFCGIGHCFDCLATVNGRPNQRACLLPAAPGDVVTTQSGDGRADLAD
ncbi:(2Fe-2S)-binding protein [Streptomyces alkaliterrae]|uniref:(2Fe-2S)-binding protein n=1 Tax=Streptomyces alkaliterrae TaxID=2213162 RepID=A0A5P0YWW3_9ACTN|nr:(2Fe-2S)-binding protein [Streptomyces alkaliterrae]MBB1255564.1 (2Fe-2S)-binding protein [Streptomyces alkaliterrae]MBB1259805.1 (2Fe-2S)-binding protein [Streptomyces alkaliterrae]MQS03992.1 (2Fe-2S)-binding protein [Streptomyces alkaliterrae]